MSDGTDNVDGATPEEPTRRRLGWPWKLAIGLGVLAIVVALVLPVVSMLQPRYYERYPELGERMENWRASTHALMSCADCHVDPGVGGMMAFAARSVPAFYSQLVQGPHSDNLLRTPDREACQKCHTSYREVSSSGDLLIPHQAHVEVLEMECATCHQDLVHSSNEHGFNKPEMTMCLETCHDGEQASTECIDCHTRKNVPESHEASDWLEVHADKIDTVDCGECHAWSPDYCADCHAKRPASHAGNWKNDHQYPALDRGEKGCMTCHDEAFCNECH